MASFLADAGGFSNANVRDAHFSLRTPHPMRDWRPTDMDARTRFIVFGAGACLGALLLWFFNQHGTPQREHRKAVMASLSLPGMYYDYAVQQKSLFGHYVLAERRFKRADGGVRRELITGGRNRFDEAGRARPNELLLVTEDYAPGVEPAEEAKVTAVSFAYADRAEVVFRQAIPAGWTWDVRFEATPDSAKPNHVWLRLRSGAGLKEEALFALVDHVRSLEGNAAVALARPVMIDWKAEADLIRKESGQ